MATTYNYAQDEDKVQKAKDFIWEHLEEPSRILIIHMLTNNEFKETDVLLIGFTDSNNRSLYRDTKNVDRSPINILNNNHE